MKQGKTLMTQYHVFKCGRCNKPFRKREAAEKHIADAHLKNGGEVWVYGRVARVIRRVEPDGSATVCRAVL